MVAVKSRMSKVSLIFAAGTALFSDGYANGVIGSVNTLLTRIYGKEAINGHNYSKTLTSVAFAGTVVGMLVFGYLSDKLGRKFGMMLATGIVALFSGLSAASSGAHHSLGGMLAMLSACRFLLGIGVGAEYPCGSVAASEQSEEEGINKKAQHRWFALATNTMIDFGFVVAAFVPLVLYWIFGPNHLRAVWRLSLGLGLIPAVAVFIWRLNMEEPTRFKKDSMKNTKIPYLLIIRRYWKSLAAISTTWFIYDFIVYQFSIYSSTVVSNITNNSTSLSVVFGWNVVINLFYIPGTIGGAFIVDYLGPKNTMITGLLLQAIIGFIMSGLYKQLTDHIGAFAVVYGIFLSFGELGPGNCLGLLAAKTGPTAVRGQFYGLAAAVGKVGAFVGTWAFPPIIADFGGDTTTKGNTGPFWIASGLAVLSALITFFGIKPLTQDGMLKEDQEFRAYLEAHGWDTTLMGIGSTENSQDFPETEKESAASVKEV
ncbi:major facilitator superfamily [Heterobasidion irregulare TC 32-1]|uniref:Major facilitator superfamily n=1 Tax=Heterobasidion irregulare (strain TC 32-1) TaxID=747525 RepID=W4KAN6_HETIT|nr:major facilitator superfamily [Heterobasidion irregulare TC 32-1]ETW82848.1 major facilitator superfamily [Heterobasidion irregulare TC 32-1]